MTVIIFLWGAGSAVFWWCFTHGGGGHGDDDHDGQGDLCSWFENNISEVSPTLLPEVTQTIVDHLSATLRDH